MLYYRDSQNKVYAFEEDGSQSAFIGESLVLITWEQAQILIESNKPNTPPKTKFSAREFLRKLSLQEKIDLKTSEDIQVQLWYDELIAADFVDIEDQDTIDATNYGVFKGIFSELRRDELLAPETIEE